MSQEAMLEFARRALASGNEEASKFSGRCLNSQRISSALHEAQPHLAITPSELDAHPYLLNFANGTVDLRTGQLARTIETTSLPSWCTSTTRRMPSAPCSYAFCAGSWAMA
jgi:phage/plasmid-associated DNA primase